MVMEQSQLYVGLCSDFKIALKYIETTCFEIYTREVPEPDNANIVIYSYCFLLFYILTV